MPSGAGDNVNRLILFVLVAQLAAAQNALPNAEREEMQQRIKQLEERLTLVEDTLQTLLRERAGAAPVAPLPAPAVTRTAPPPRETMPPELIPEIGKIGAEVGILAGGSANPFHLNGGTDVGGFIDLPLFDRPQWLHGRISYEISAGLSRSRTTFTTTSNVAQVANLAILNALYPMGGTQNISDALTGTGAAPFPVTAPTVTTLKLLQVVPFSLKYTTTALDRWRFRPYALLGFGTYVTIHEQSATNSGVRLNANLPPDVIALVNQIFGGQAPFGGELVAGQIAQSPELEARGLPSGHGNIDLGWMGGGGFEFRLTRSFSLGFDARWNRIAGAPGALTTYGTRLGFHF
jgi:hypothetical protein